MFASRFSQLAGTVVNYGTNQSGVRDIASHKSDQKKLSEVLYQTLWVRAIIFLLFIIFLIGMNGFHLQYYTYLLLALPMVFAEVVNPLFFFIGVEKLRAFNLANLISNVVCILLLILFVKKPGDAAWVNFILGGANAVTYLALLFYIFPQFKIQFYLPKKNELLKLGQYNFYLTINNISVQLQQSIMIFGLTKYGNTSILGAYSLCDRIIGQGKNLHITISNAIYPTAVYYYRQSVSMWNAYRKKVKYMVTSLFFTGSVLLFVLADFIVYTLTKEHNALAVLYLKTMAITPTLGAINFPNVLDQLLKNNTVYIFRIAVILLAISFIVAYVLLNFGNFMFVGAFTVIIETCALLMYESILKKPPLKNA